MATLETKKPPRPSPPETKESESIKEVNNVIVTVEKTGTVGKRQETFITQKGGKIIQGLMEIKEEEQEALLQDRRSLQSTLLLQKKKEMMTVQQQLNKRRQEFAKRMEECKEKQDELRAKQKQIKERVIKFEKFLKENDAKRIRANAKAITEKKLKEQKEQELIAIQKQLQIEQTKAQKIFTQIKSHEGYERYLQSIVDALPPDYLDVHEPQINDIIMRYKTLTETNQDLLSDVQRNQDQLEHYQTTLQGLVKEKNDIIMVYNSKLGTKQKLLDKLKQETAYAEDELEKRTNLGKERMRMLSETKLAIDDLYERTKEQSKKKMVNKNETIDIQIEVPTTQEAVKPIKMSYDDKSYTIKLHALQFRVLDLEDIIQFEGLETTRKKGRKNTQ